MPAVWDQSEPRESWFLMCDSDKETEDEDEDEDEDDKTLDETKGEGESEPFAWTKNIHNGNGGKGKGGKGKGGKGKGGKGKGGKGKGGKGKGGKGKGGKGERVVECCTSCEERFPSNSACYSKNPKHHAFQLELEKRKIANGLETNLCCTMCGDTHGDSHGSACISMKKGN
jgi:hypothetical protein